MNLMPYLIARMREASSYAGLVGMLLGALHLAASPDLVNAALGAVAALGGLLAVLIPEQAPEAAPAPAPAPAAATTAAAATAPTLLSVALAGALLLGLSACAGSGLAIAPAAATAGTSSSGGAGKDPLNGIAGFVTADLQNALQIAKANNDAAAVQCYQYLVPQVAAAQQQLGSLAPANISGGFSAFEAGRVAVTSVKGFVNGVPAGLNLACAPLVLDAGNTLVGLAAKVGVTIALPAAGGLLPAL